MTLYEQGLNKIRDYIHDKLNEGKLGSDGAPVIITDTDIKNEIDGTTKNLTSTKKDKSLKIDYFTDAGDGQDNTAREFVMTDTDDTVLTRVSFPGEDLTDTSVVNITTQLIIIQDI